MVRRKRKKERQQNMNKDEEQQLQEATAEGIKKINEAAPSEKMLTLRSLEAFEKAADGQATKIIVPSNIQGLAGLVTSAVEIAKTDKE